MVYIYGNQGYQQQPISLQIIFDQGTEIKTSTLPLKTTPFTVGLLALFLRVHCQILLLVSSKLKRIN